MNIFLLIAIAIISFTGNDWLKSFCSGVALIIALFNVGEGISRYKNEKVQVANERV